MATITCQDCGAERQRTPSNTKFCKPCRLLRDLDYWRARWKRCRGCKAEFAPLNRPDNLCSSCNPGLKAYPVDCVLCQAPGLAAVVGIPVCASCIRAPKRRHKLIEALERGQARRKASNNATPQA